MGKALLTVVKPPFQPTKLIKYIKICGKEVRFTHFIKNPSSKMSLWVDKHRPNQLIKLDYHKEQAIYLKKLVRMAYKSLNDNGCICLNFLKSLVYLMFSVDRMTSVQD